MLVRTRREAALRQAERTRLPGASAYLGRILALAAVVAFGTPLSRSLCAGEPPHPQPVGIVSRIERQPVESRALAAVGYSKRLRALEVEFRRGGTYRYLDVPHSVYDALLTAESKAGFYNQNVRGKYRSVYVRPRRKR